MKNIISYFKSVELFSFMLGAAFSACVGLILFSVLVPGGLRAISNYHTSMFDHQINRNEDEIELMYDAAKGEMSNHTMHTSPANPYAMARITSEKQFLKEMKLHHEAAVTMAREVLALKNVRAEVKTLANNIINAQTTEIKMMKDWIAAWKY